MLIFVAVILALGSAFAAYYFWKQGEAAEERTYIDELDRPDYDVDLDTQERQAYYDLLEEEKEGKATPNQLMVALLNRAIAAVPRIERIENDRPRMQKVHRHSYIPTSALEDVMASEHELHVEVEEVRAEAERLKEGWGKSIYAQAFRIVRKKRLEAKRPMGQWSQTPQDLKLGLPLPPGLPHEGITVDFEKESLVVTFHPERPKVHFSLEAPINGSECKWQVQEDMLQILLVKETHGMWKAPTKQSEGEEAR